MRSQRAGSARAVKAFWLLGLVLCILIYLLRQADLPLLQHVDARLYDAGLRTLRPAAQDSVPLPLVIDIDEKSLAELGGWPWPRYRMGRLLEICMEGGALTVGFDILFTDPDALSFSGLQRRMEQDFGIEARSGLPEALRDNDALFAREIMRHPAVLASFMGETGQDFPEIREDAGAVPFAVLGPLGASSPLVRLPEAQAALLPIPELVRAGGLPGHINSLLDSDGVVRRLPLLVRHGERVLPAFALRLFMSAAKTDMLLLECDEQGLTAIIAGAVRVPLSAEGVFIPWFRLGKNVEHVSAVDVLAGRAAPELLYGRPVLVGSSAVGLNDIRSTSLRAQTAGVDIHAIALDNMLRGEFLHRPAWEGAAVFAGMVLAILSLVIAVYFLPPFGALLVLLLLCGLLWGGSLFGAERGLYISPLYAMIAAISSFILLTALRLRLEGRRKKAMQNAFSRYLAPEMVHRITEHPEQIKLMGEERELSILFLDIRGFTGIASRLSPEELVSLLNRVFTPVTRIIRECSGTVDKFVGDACLAFWNAPLDVRGHALKAALAAMRILDAVDALGADSLPPVFPLRIGIGLHFGIAHVGNMGTEELLNYTCIGDAVNITSRIEDLCKEYSASCLVSGPFVMACLRDAGEDGEAGFIRRVDDLAFYYLDSVIVRGHDRPLDIYAAIRAESLGKEGQALFDESCRLRKAGDLAAAREKVLRLHAAYPALTFLQAVARRCEAGDI